MLTVPNLERYRQGDTIQYFSNVLSLIPEATAATLQVASQRTQLDTATKNLIEKWQPAVGSALTPEISALDTQRDMTFTGFKMTVDNWATNHYDPAWRQAAFIISDNIAGHGDKITVMRYQQQTATLNAIINDCLGDHATHVATLGLTAWVTQIKNLNDTFNSKYLERTSELAIVEPGIIAALVNEAIVAFRQLKSIFEARQAIALADADPLLTQYETVASEWNSLTQQYNDAVNRYADTDPPPAPEPDSE